LESFEGASGNISSKRSFAPWLARAGTAEQLESCLFRRKCCYGRSFVGFPSFWTTFHHFASPWISPTSSILTRDLVCSSIALILLRKRHFMSVVLLTVVDVCGRFCRQTAGAAIDTVANGDEILRPTDVESNSGRATTLGLLVKKKSVQQRLSALIAVA